MIPKITYSYNTKPVFTSKKAKETSIVNVDKSPFSQETIVKLANNWSKKDLLYEGDSLILIPKHQLEEAAKIDKKIRRTLPLANLSEMGFAATIIDEDGIINTRVLEYFDPKIIRIIKLTNQIKNNKVYIVELQAQFID